MFDRTHFLRKRTHLSSAPLNRDESQTDAGVAVAHVVLREPVGLRVFYVSAGRSAGSIQNQRTTPARQTTPPTPTA